MEQQTPIPPNQGWSRAKGINAPFSHPWFGRRGDLGFPFILSKIVACGGGPDVQIEGTAQKTNCHATCVTQAGRPMYGRESWCKERTKSRHTLVCLSFSVYQYVYAVNPTQIESRDQNIFTSKFGISRWKSTPRYTTLRFNTTARHSFKLYHVEISRKYVVNLLIIKQGLEIFPYRRTQIVNINNIINSLF